MKLSGGFIKLLKRYREGRLPRHIREDLDTWHRLFSADTEKQDERKEIEDRIWAGIERGTRLAVENGANTPDRVGAGAWWKAAAAIVLVAGATVYFYNKSFRSRDVLPGQTAKAEAAAGWKVVGHDGPESREVFLPDGSKVVLQPGGKLRYPAVFSPDQREVFLEGSGFFDVKREVDRPFVVFSGQVLTRVLGTSFTIRPVAAGGTEVAVVTGKVTVEKATPDDKREGKNRVILTPNRKVTFFNQSEHYVTGLVDEPRLVSDEMEYLLPGAFNFDETPLHAVIEKLEKAYGVEIAVSNDEVLECPVTADLTSDNLYEKMEIISAVLQSRVEVNGSTILLSGGGCKKINAKP